MKNYPLFKVHIDKKKALENISEVLDSGFINEGTQVAKFTEELAQFLGHENIICLNSGTSALTLALKLSGVHNGDEVITTPMTCVATNTPIENLGGEIVWADVLPRTGSIDPDDVMRKITSKTKAVMCVAWAGNPCDLDRLYSLCKANSIFLIQDAAHAFGAKWRGKNISHYADFTCYSFQAIKHISSGDGGLLVCNDPTKLKLAKKLKWFGIDREEAKDEDGNWKGQSWSVDIKPDEIGYKFNMNNISAAIGLSQIPHLNDIIKKHQSNAKVFEKRLSNIKKIEIIKQHNHSESAYWVYTLLFDESINRDNILIELNKVGIQAGQVHVPNDNYSCWAHKKTNLPGVRYFSSNQISLPCGWWLDEEDINHISNKLIELLRV